MGNATLSSAESFWTSLVSCRDEASAYEQVEEVVNADVDEIVVDAKALE